MPVIYRRSRKAIFGQYVGKGESLFDAESLLYYSEKTKRITPIRFSLSCQSLPHATGPFMVFAQSAVPTAPHPDSAAQDANAFFPDKRNGHFAFLGRPRRIWAIGAVHGQFARLAEIHDWIAPRIEAGDRLIYLGNMTGYGAQPVETIDEILAFRRAILALPGMKADDIIFLRGRQEEMFQKLQHMAFAPNPRPILEWMLRHGLEATLRGYGLPPEEGLKAAEDGTMGLTRWAAAIRAATKNFAAHDILPGVLQRAAWGTDPENGRALVLVHSGLDLAAPMTAQGDTFWWGDIPEQIRSAERGRIARVIRGYAGRSHVHATPHALTLHDGPAGASTISAACLNLSGQVLDLKRV